MTCCEKYENDVRLNLHTFAHVVSEAGPEGCSINNSKFIRKLSKFIRK